MFQIIFQCLIPTVSVAQFILNCKYAFDKIVINDNDNSQIMGIMRQYVECMYLPWLQCYYAGLSAVFLLHLRGKGFKR